MATVKVMKENQHVMPSFDMEAKTVSLEFKGMGTQVLHMDKLHADVKEHAAYVGMSQVRLVDAAAVPAADKDGNIIPEATRLRMKYDRVAALIAHYETGTTEWSRVGDGTGNKSITLEAIAKVKGITYAEAEAYIAAYATRNYEGDTKECLAFFRGAGKVQEAMEAIRKARMGPAKVDADAALDELKA